MPTPRLVHAPMDLPVPRWAANAAGYVSCVAFCSIFYVVPTTSAVLLYRIAAAKGVSEAMPWLAMAAAWVGLAFLPYRRWKPASWFLRSWYGIFDVRTNLHELPKPPPPSEQRRILAMHPHGVIPVHSLIWSALCEQFYPHIYGFAAAADVLLRLPLMRQVCGSLNTYGSTRRELDQRLATENLFITLDGIRGIFEAMPGREVAVDPKNRMGLMKLAVKHRSILVPCYVFGAQDQWINLAGDANSLLGRLSRRLRVSIVLFVGAFPWILPIPRFAPLSFVFGEEVDAGALRARAARSADPHASPSSVDASAALLVADAYRASLQSVFERFKAAAGCPRATLELL